MTQAIIWGIAYKSTTHCSGVDRLAVEIEILRRWCRRSDFPRQGLSLQNRKPTPEYFALALREAGLSMSNHGVLAQDKEANIRGQEMAGGQGRRKVAHGDWRTGLRA